MMEGHISHLKVLRRFVDSTEYIIQLFWMFVCLQNTFENPLRTHSSERIYGFCEYPVYVSNFVINHREKKRTYLLNRSHVGSTSAGYPLTRLSLTISRRWTMGKSSIANNSLFSITA